MSIVHFVVFVGASASLSDELGKISKRIQGVKVVAPAMDKQSVGLTAKAIERASCTLHEILPAPSDRDEKHRLSVWSFAQDNPENLRLLITTFGGAAWIEFIPSDLNHKISQTRLEIENRIVALLPKLHEVSRSVYAERRSSPLPLPLKNFKSSQIEVLKRLWYRDLSANELRSKVSTLTSRFRTNHYCASGGFLDDRKLRFAPAKNNECHGQAHPNGSSRKSLLRGVFRFGVTIYPGFHYDVTNSNPNRSLECTFRDCDGFVRDMKPEHRKHVNVFPNDTLLPNRTRT